ncbi:hypothetical protein [Roseivirga sp. UBA838]|uniref:hypothetical protein n=1 Tax=Roseivirga sp. UBA838 TaxID=1947393 RepID=UPI00257EA17F|nr:hypothetical protein [Roseivirga sp. UBA838]|tara:strand:- start:26539 stop:26727 length:189 start_codon:yes stop_codon:yes gene_type:complete
MDKLALGLSLVTLLCIPLFFAISYAMGLLEEWKEVKRPFSSKTLKMTKKLDLNQDPDWKQAA